jgi:hypothetical protein
MIGIAVNSFSAPPQMLHAGPGVSAPESHASVVSDISTDTNQHRSPSNAPKVGNNSLLNPENLIQAQAQVKPGELTEAEEQMVKELKGRDAEVHRHEEAHARAGGAYSGTPSYQFQRGPDGGQYAIGGTTPIDVSPLNGDPEGTIRKMAIIKRAASAPSHPSGADRSVMAQADAQIQAARAELARERQAEQEDIHSPDEAETTVNPSTGTFGAMDFARSAKAYQAIGSLQIA